MIQFFSFEKTNSNLITLDGNPVSKSYGKEVYNVAKVVLLGTGVKDSPVQVGDIVSVPDEMLEAIPDGSRGFKDVQGVAEPKAGYIPLGKIMPFIYLKDKLGKPTNDLLFIIPISWIKVIHNKDVLILSAQQEQLTLDSPINPEGI
jgi:hypothetical protein